MSAAPALLKNNCFLRALLKQPVDRTPVWIMRQAGRYFPEYRKIREKDEFITVYKTPELATEVTLQPLRRFGFDAAILFSDILVVPEALGQRIEFLKDHGPRLSPQLLDARSIATLSLNSVEERLNFVAEAIRMIRRELDGKTALIGFSGSPFTLATYMIEGKPGRNFKFIKKMLFSEPQQLLNLLELLTEATTRYLVLQIEAGVQAIQIFDTWGGALTPGDYCRFSLQPMERIIHSLKRENDGRKVPVILFTKNGGQWLEAMTDTGADALGLDWTTDLADARRRVGEQVALQGNLDPSVLYASPKHIREQVARVLASFGKGDGHVFNLGHGIHPGINPDHAGAMIEAVHELSREYHV